VFDRLQDYITARSRFSMADPAVLSLPTPSPSLPSTPGPLAPENPLASTSTVPASAGLAQRLRDATAQAHQDVMMPAVVHKLVKGQLSRSMHLRYLMLLYGVYSALEDALAAHATHPCLSGVYNPALLSRAGALESDCEYYTGEREWHGKSEEGWELQKDKPEAVRQYEARLRDLGEKEEGETGERSPTLLLAHAYVRYREYTALHLILSLVLTYLLPASQSATSPEAKRSPAPFASPTPSPTRAKDPPFTSSTSPTPSLPMACPNAPTSTRPSASRSGSAKDWIEQER
jgi:hypothetical protein